ncbi:lipoyl(octanoyl) transferase LipB [Ectothiorhodospira lacustris]|uniref:lipoyl(octanoyl) transferase LipB n=1 Tax=Ectothiorhodospira lacustris TaxID=2899127 RepID=UPI001EE7C266|nr:lipoyl(octanoyl) transferase LipB [Ectothiorhodospira lacustris]MCG5499927.1 lipoyl(octanoyl) transferase LipB [Ectothiorhodospira lacustris]MCG5508846.1 lipoyl(octanoyl) transferase LipB [Ectothiorhodospira lacustris]MCG5520637.1 lipoyl(octanoyl) transferase LipB [Ectothiorhodospira lacustris]
MSAILVRRLGRCDYESTWRRMQAFTEHRDAGTLDELWQVEHPPVFTLGLNGKPEHVLDPGDIPVIPVDRGGQVTYHGPGQVVIYTLLDLRRSGLGVRALVTALESAVIDYLATQGIAAQARAEAPGVYVGDAKIAALGLRVRRGGSYHGLAFNLDPDLSAFDRINPCGYRGLATTSLAALGGREDWRQAATGLTKALSLRLGRPVTAA